jgi:hypothetical protein
VSRQSRWRRNGRKAISEVIGAILLLALTMIALVILYQFNFRTAPPSPNISFNVRPGDGYPAWGDPTDCQPQGSWTYPLPGSEDNAWSNEWYSQCYTGTSGNFSTLNVTQLVVSAISPMNIPLADIQMTFVCSNSSATGGRTVLLTGSLASMVWFPGSTTQPAPDAPHLGHCGNFDAGNYSGVAGLTPANGTLYNRLGMFVPLTPGDFVLGVGDTLILYIHNGGWPTTFLCVAASVGLYASWTCPNGDGAVPLPDYDDYHGMPPWCFTVPGACTIYFSYTGNPASVIATIPVTTLQAGLS